MAPFFVWLLAGINNLVTPLVEEWHGIPGGARMTTASGALLNQWLIIYAIGAVPVITHSERYIVSYASVWNLTKERFHYCCKSVIELDGPLTHWHARPPDNKHEPFLCTLEWKNAETTLIST